MTARLPGLLAAAVIAGVAVLYLGIIRSEPGPNPMDVVAAYAGAMLVAAALAAGGTFATDPYLRRLQFGVAGAITLVCAWLGALSIGVLFLPALLLLAFALGRG
jgi:hypothetical protein